MGEGADADDVHAGQGVIAEGFEAHATGDFDDGRACDDRDGAANERGRHVIEQDHFGTGANGFFHFGERGGFDLDLRRVGGGEAGELHGLGERAGGGDVVVFDEDVLAEGGAVVHAAAAAHGVFLECAPAGCGLARIDDAGGGAGEGIRVAARLRGDAGEALNEIEGGALGGEERCSGAGDGENLGAVFDAVPVGGGEFYLKRGVDPGEDGGGDVDAAEREVLAGLDKGAGAVAQRKDRAAGDVAEPGVFVEGEVNQVSGARREHKIENKAFPKVCHLLHDKFSVVAGVVFSRRG